MYLILNQTKFHFLLFKTNFNIIPHAWVTWVASSFHVFQLRFCVPFSFPIRTAWSHNIPSSIWTPHCLLKGTNFKIYDFLQSHVVFMSLKHVFSSRCSLLKHLRFWKSVRNVMPCSLVPFWVDTTGVSETLLHVHESARLHVPDVRNLYGNRCENSKFNSCGIHTARETKFSSLKQTNEILMWHWSWTSFSYAYILRTRHFGDWLCLHPRVKVSSVGPII